MFFLISCLFLGSVSWSQTELAQTGFSSFSSPDYSGPGSLGSAKQFNISMSYPFFLDKDTTNILFTTLSYDIFDEGFSFDSLPQNPALHFGFLRLTYLRRLGRYTLYLFATPGVASDFRGEINSKDYNITGGGILTKSYLDKRLSIGLGVASTYVWGDERILAIVKAKYRSLNKRFYIDMTVPMIEAMYSPKKHLWVGVQSWVQGMSYSIASDQWGVTQANHIQYSNYIFGPKIAWEFGDNLYFNVHGGMHVSYRFELTEQEDGKPILNRDGNSFNGYFFKSSFSYRI